MNIHSRKLRSYRGGGRGQVGCADIDVVGVPGRVGAGGNWEVFWPSGGFGGSPPIVIDKIK